MNDLKLYWNNRVQQVGHTGWMNRYVYTLDQYARLKVIRKIVKDLFDKTSIENALDYGCGIGDFSKLLGSFAKDVFSYDIADEVIKRAGQQRGLLSNIIYSSSEEQLNIRLETKRHDLILSITVLGHILDEMKLELILQKLKNSLSPNGYLVLIEFVAEKSDQNNYQKFNTSEKWSSLFKYVGLIVEKKYSMDVPNNPTGVLYKSLFSKINVFLASKFDFMFLLLIKKGKNRIDNSNDFILEVGPLNIQKKLSIIILKR